MHSLAILLLLFLLAPGASAQDMESARAAPERVERAKPVERRLYVGMWTIHFRDLDRGLDNNWLLGMSWGRMYGATFINSFGKRAYSGGMQQTVARWQPEIASIGAGYRVGLVTGYNERLFRLAGETPVLPFFQPLVTLDARRIGLELSYAGVVASAALNARW